MRGGRLTVLPPLAPAALLREPAQTPPFPLREPGCVLYDSARLALWQGLRALGLGAGDGVLVPVLHRGPEIEVLQRAGLRPILYAGTSALEPDEEQLERLLEPGVRALYLIHQLGYAQDGERWRAWCEEHDLLLLEDATQAWTASLRTRPVGSFGALAVFSLPLAFGLPDGGALLVASPPGEPAPQERRGVGGLARGHGRWLAQRMPGWPALARLPARSAHPAWAPAEVARGPSRGTLHLLHRVADAHAAVRRRSHCTMLGEELGDLVPEPFRTLALDAPLGCPIACGDGDSDAMLDRLRARGVQALRPWAPVDPGLGGEHRAASQRARRTLLLPVHQQLRPADVARIAAAVLGTRRVPRAELRLEEIDALEAPHAEWADLALRSGSVFATQEWISTWWRHFGDGWTPRLVACRAQDGRLAAILPLCVKRRGGLAVVRFLGHGPSDECGPICAPADRPAAARALSRQLRRMRADVLLGEQVAAQAGWDALLGARVLRREGSPVLAIDTPSWTQLLARFGTSIRKKVGGLTRKLDREHGIAYRTTATAAELPVDFETLLRLHRARWEGPTTFVRQAGFHAEFAELALRRGWLRLLMLELDGEPAATLHSLRFAGTETHYQSGRDPTWNQRSVGMLIVVEAIRLAQEAGLGAFRFGRGDESYKYRFASGDPGVQTIGLGASRPGTAAIAAIGEVPTALVKRVRRLAGS